MKSQMVIYVPFIDKLHCECDQNAGNGFAKLKNMQRVCVWGGGVGGGGGEGGTHFKYSYLI